MKIQTERLTLRPLCTDDLHAAYKWQSDAESQKYIDTPNTDLSQTAEYLEWVTSQWQSDHQTNHCFGIVLEDKLIGEIGCSSGCGKCGRCVKGEVPVGYNIHRDYFNCGYEMEAVNAVIEYCFSVLNAEKIIMSCDVENIAELHLIKNLGMQLRTENEECEYSDGRPFKRNTYFLNNNMYK